MRIKRLPEELARLIAAGEVVESPLSVVKELVENSLDANATRIEVRVLEGGLRLIEVRDNGIGIPREDLPLAVQRYATSKIETPEDLLRIRSYGFRGEALFAISQVSKLTIESRYKGEESGSKIVVHNGQIVEIGTSNIVSGTSVKVEMLLASYPGRRKAIRVKTEENKIRDFLKRLALGVSAGIKLIINGKEAFSTLPNEPLPNKMKKLWGWSIKDMARIFKEEFQLSFDAYLSLPPVAHRDSSKLITFVNHRLVSPPEILESVRIAYDKIFHLDGFPHGVIFLSLPPNEVDFNVHPRKLEVRFLKPIMVRGFISKLLEEELPKYSENVSERYAINIIYTAAPIML